MEQIYIGDCFCLTPRRVDDSLLHRVRKIGDNTDYYRKDIRYEYGQTGDQYFILVTIEGHERQRIITEMPESSYMGLQYFLCGGCNSRCQKLYLLPGGYIFRCMNCHKIQHRPFDPSSHKERLSEMSRKVVELFNDQADAKSKIWNKGAYAKQYPKSLKASLINIVNEILGVEPSVPTIKWRY